MVIVITSHPILIDSPAENDYDEVHIVPIYSRREHDLSKDCWCHPDPDPECHDMFIHNVEQ
jgi:hypothetical protein